MINMYQAKTNLSQLVSRALAGEEIVLAKSGTPLVMIVPYAKQAKARTPGKYKGKIKIPKDFDTDLPDVEALFSQKIDL